MLMSRKAGRNHKTHAHRNGPGVQLATAHMYSSITSCHRPLR